MFWKYKKKKSLNVTKCVLVKLISKVTRMRIVQIWAMCTNFKKCLSTFLRCQLEQWWTTTKTVTPTLDFKCETMIWKTNRENASVLLLTMNFVIALSKYLWWGDSWADVMTKFIANRTNAWWKTDVYLFNKLSSCPLSLVDASINFKFTCLSAYWQWARKNFCSYRKKGNWQSAEAECSFSPNKK